MTPILDLRPLTRPRCPCGRVATVELVATGVAVEGLVREVHDRTAWSR